MEPHGGQQGRQPATRLRQVVRRGGQRIAGCPRESLRAGSAEAGRIQAREPLPKCPVSDDAVARTLPFLPTVVADMVPAPRGHGRRRAVRHDDRGARPQRFPRARRRWWRSGGEGEGLALYAVSTFAVVLLTV